MTSSLTFPLFDGTGLDPFSLPFARVSSFEDGEVMVFPSGLGLVCAGAVRVDREEEHVLLNIIHRGGLFGVSTLMSGDRRPGTRLSAEKDTQILFLPEADFVSLLSENRLLLQNYLAFVSRRICFLNDRLGTFSSQTAETKLLRYILQNGGQITVTTMSELASSLSMGRASLYRVVDRLVEAGRLRRDGDCMTLL